MPRKPPRPGMKLLGPQAKPSTGSSGIRANKKSTNICLETAGTGGFGLSATQCYGPGKPAAQDAVFCVSCAGSSPGSSPSNPAPCYWSSLAVMAVCGVNRRQDLPLFLLKADFQRHVNNCFKSEIQKNRGALPCTLSWAGGRCRDPGSLLPPAITSLWKTTGARSITALSPCFG